MPNTSPITPESPPNPRELAAIFKGLADENRLRLLFALADGEKTVSLLVSELGLSQPLVSHHLKELKHALLIRMERRGPFVYCRPADPRIMELLQEMRTLAPELRNRRQP